MAGGGTRATASEVAGQEGLGSGTPESHGRLAAFLQRLHELGWIEGRNLSIEYRWANGSPDRAAEFAAEFVQHNVDVIVTYANPMVIATKRATSLIPIVFAAAADPLGTGLVATSGATGRQRHGPIDPTHRSCEQAPRTFARDSAGSSQAGRHGQCRQFCLNARHEGSRSSGALA